MAHVFLSYSREDQDAMTAVKQALLASGAAVWTDETLEPGTPVWQWAIEDRISTASCVVVLLSPAAKQSHWVRAEITRARFEQIDVVPLLVRGEREADIVPLGLENANWIDIRRNRNAGLGRLVETVSRIAGAGGAIRSAVPEPQVSSECNG